MFLLQRVRAAASTETLFSTVLWMEFKTAEEQKEQQQQQQKQSRGKWLAVGWPLSYKRNHSVILDIIFNYVWGRTQNITGFATQTEKKYRTPNQKYLNETISNKILYAQPVFRLNERNTLATKNYKPTNFELTLFSYCCCCCCFNTLTSINEWCAHILKWFVFQFTFCSIEGH